MKNNFSSNFSFLRKQKGYTQEEIGKKLDKDYSSIGKWEKGINSPSMEDAFKVAELFNVDIADILTKDLRFEDNIVENNDKLFEIGDVKIAFYGDFDYSKASDEEKAILENTIKSIKKNIDKELDKDD